MSPPSPPSPESPGRTWALGDIHGCATALAVLVETLQPTADDTLVVLGDVIDRGPDTRNVLRQLLKLREATNLVCILGNHEQMMLDAIDGSIPVQEWLRHGGAEALDSYGKGSGVNAVDDQHIEFVRSWGDVFETPGEFFAHGNYWATRSLDRQPWQDLRWQSLHWHTPEPHRSGKTAILGHTSNKKGRVVNLGHLVCIDTYCCGGQWLTALEPATGRLWQSRESGELREGDLPPTQAKM